jgi:hypothetical protein
MKRNTYYFPHDFEPTADPKIQALIGEFGASGYGVFWRVIEMLHSDRAHKLPFKKYVFLAIAKQMLANAEQIEAILNYCIDPCELIKTDGDFFWSERVLRNTSERAKLSEIRAIAGRAGAFAKQKSAKRGKGKEIKGKEESEKIEFSTRISNFSKQVKEYQNQFPEEMLQSFINYWTEPNPSKTKMRWEMEKVFDIPRRLATWASRQKNFSSGVSGSMAENNIVALKKPISSDTI